MQAVTPKGLTPPYFNVVDFGAVGNGVHDDTIAILAALNAALGGTSPVAGGVVWFPGLGNTYVVSQPLGTYTGVSLMGVRSRNANYQDGSVLLPTLTAGQVLITLRLGGLTDLCIDGTNMAATATGVVLSGIGNDVTTVSRRCMYYSITNPLTVDGADDQYTIEGNTFDSCTTATGQQGVLRIAGSAGHFPPSMLRVRDNVFVGCTATQDATDGAIYVQGSNSTLGARDWVVEGNVAADASNHLTNGVYVAAGSGGGVIPDYYAIINNDFSIATTPVNDNGQGTHKSVQTAPMSFGSAAPSGAAGGDLTGTYPNPTVKASVGLTGTPTAPTGTVGDNTTQIATDAFVTTALTTLNASNLTSGSVPTARFPGGAFNGNSELVQTTAAGKYPALDGSLITNLPASLPAAVNAAALISAALTFR